MTENVLPGRRASAITWVGLFVALFGMLIVRQVVNHFWPTPSFNATVIKEMGMWGVGLLLPVIIKLGEGLPLSSIGLGTVRFWKSVLWGVVLGVVLLVVAGLLVALTHFNGGEPGQALGKLPVWLVSLIVLRAGVVEELCYRGYAIERLHALGLPRWIAAAVPLVIFGLRHWTGGLGKILLRPWLRTNSTFLLCLTPDIDL